MNKKIIITVLGLFVLGAAYYFWQRDSPEEQIKARIDEFLVAVHLPQKSQGLTQIGKINGMRHFFTEQVKAKGRGHEIEIASHEQLLKYAHMAFRMQPKFKLSIEDVTIEMIDSSSATVYFTALAQGVDRNWAGAQELKIKVRKESGDWLIFEGEAIEALSVDK